MPREDTRKPPNSQAGRLPQLLYRQSPRYPLGRRRAHHDHRIATVGAMRALRPRHAHALPAHQIAAPRLDTLRGHVVGRRGLSATAPQPFLQTVGLP